MAHEKQENKQPQHGSTRGKNQPGLFELIGDREKLQFLKHFTLYFIAVLASAFMNNHIYTLYQWWLVLSLGWGVIVLFHFIYLYIIKPRILLFQKDQQS